MPDTPETTESAEAPVHADPPRASRRRAFAFVAIFLCTTFVLLTAFQFVRETAYLQRYLFVLASHTAAVLNLVTETSYLEYRTQDDLPKGEQAQIRAEIAAWQAGVAPQALPAEERDVGPPLTRWEWFQHRTLKEKADHAEERAIVESLTNLERETVFDNAEQHIAHLVERAAVLEASIRRPLPGGGERERGDRDAIRALQEIEQGLAFATSGSFELNDESFQALLAMDQSLEDARQKQLAYATRRLGYLDEFLANSGPLVMTVWDRGLRGEVNAARERMTQLSQDPALSEAERLEALTAVRAEIRELEDAIKEETRQGAEPAVIEGRQFRFSIIPECGAIETMVIFIAAVLGFPTLGWKRLAGILLGIPLLYVVNVFRLACLGLIGTWFTDERVFDFAHHYVWQAIYLVFVVVIWLLWLELLVRRGEKPSPQDA